MIRVWITCFILLFGASELLQWVKQFSLPLPVFIVGGAFLAIASNYDKLTHLPFHPNYEAESSEEIPPLPSTPSSQPANAKRKPLNTVSFEIRKPFQPGD
jgi:hypothetical protein